MKLCLRCQYIFSSPNWTCPSCNYEPIFLNGVVAHDPSLADSGGGFKAKYFAELAELEANNFWFRARNELIVWALRTYKAEAKNFLEIGCGTGFVLSGIASENPQIQLSGSEIFLTGLSHASTRVPSANFMQMDARRIPFIKEFDAIGAFDVLEHIEEDEVALAQIHRALRPGGVFFVTVPQHRWLWSASDEYACHVRRYGRTEIEKKFEKSGFKIIRTTSFVTCLLPAMMLSRLRSRRTARTYDPADELKISSILNKIFYSMMTLEIASIKMGLNYPVGGSRLVVAVAA